MSSLFPILTSGTCQSESRREKSGYQPDFVRGLRTTPGYLDRVGTFYLPVFTLVRITEFLLFRTPCFTITNLKFPSLGTVLESKAKKIRIRVPTTPLLMALILLSTTNTTYFY
jgi:hypothetical protein